MDSDFSYISPLWRHPSFSRESEDDTRQISQTFEIFIDYAAKHSTKTPDEIIQLIKQGRNCLRALTANQRVPSSKENILSTIWALNAMAFAQEKSAFSRGVIRLINDHNETLYGFFLDAQDEKGNPAAYSRISTHFKDLKVGSQSGIDFTKGELHDKTFTTLLFGKLRDGSLFFKCETAGVNFFAHPLTSLKHLGNWALKVIRGREESIHGVETRREKDTPRLIASQYKRVVKSLKALVKTLKKEAIVSKKEVKHLKHKRWAFQKKEALSHLRHSLDQKLTSTQKQDPRYAHLYESIEACEKAFEKIPRAELACGNEVVLVLPNEDLL